MPIVHVIHVGPMNNIGTKALLSSDVTIIREITDGKVAISVSTSDIEGVDGLNLNLGAVVPPFIDIPFQNDLLSLHVCIQPREFSQ